ncbi:SLBB domain-containing protein [Rubrivirga sp.]|uniref:SLBB domain-containing protein n=1 Tax=Rubrivirga sp. TaxID=1885344 RepID=UPI003C777B95
MRYSVLLLAIVPLLASPQPADDPITRIGRSERTVSTAPGYYQHHMPGEATIQVQVSGNVVNPGLYEIADETDLRRLLALAGGPQVDIRDPQSDRRVEIRLFRPGTGMLYGALLSDAVSNPVVIPPLRHDDALLVEVVDKRRLGWQDAATALGAVGTLAFIISVLGG